MIVSSVVYCHSSLKVSLSGLNIFGKALSVLKKQAKFFLAKNGEFGLKPFSLLNKLQTRLRKFYFCFNFYIYFNILFILYRTKINHPQSSV